MQKQNGHEAGKDFDMKKVKGWIVLCLLTGLLAGCGVQNTAGNQTGSATEGAASVSGSAVRKKPEEIHYVAENKEYGIALPELDVFAEELENYIYWTHATNPVKDTEDLYSNLLEEYGPKQDLNMTLFYEEIEDSYFDEVDEEGRRCYHIIVRCQPQGREAYFELLYNAKGLGVYDRSSHSSELLVKRDDFSDEDGEDDFKSIQKDCKSYTKWGETVLHIDTSAAEQYVESEEMSRQKEEIRQDCLKEIQTDRKEDQEIYIYDFLPGDDWIHGRILYTDLEDGDVPVSWLNIHVCYKGKKMETYNGLIWYPRSSTMFNGGEYSLKAARDTLEELQEEMLPEKCFMAYRIKDGELISLKDPEK